MKQIKVNGHIINVDKQKTIELYEKLPLISEEAHCGCSECSYYTKAITETSTAIQRFFEQFGIDPRKEAEVWRACENEDGTIYYVADYHFIGQIESTHQLEWINVDEASFGLTNYTGYLPSALIPSTFMPPIVELMVKVNLPAHIMDDCRS